MTPSHFWPWHSWTLLGLNIIVEAAVLWLAISRKMSKWFVSLPLFAGFCLLSDFAYTILGLTAKVDAANGQMWYSHSYWLFYWSDQIIAGGFVLFIALQVLSVALPPWDRLISLIAIIVCTGLAVIYYKLLPIHQPSDLLAVVALADVVTVMSLPIIAVVKPSDWPKGIGLVVSGLVISLILQVGCMVSARLLKTLVGTVSVGPAVAALIGMTFFLAAVLKGASERSQTTPLSSAL